MSKWIICAVMIAGLSQPSLRAQATSTNAAPVNPAQLREGTSTTTPDNVRFLKKPGPMKACMARIVSLKGKQCDIIFIGDSITERWLGPGKAIWDKDYAPHNALDFGCSGDKTQNVLWRLDHLDVKDLNPKVAVILVGTNNTKSKPQEIADGVKAVITKTQSLYPKVKIILVSIMPNQRAQDLMMSVNPLIKEFADDKSIYWLDLVPLMPAVTTTTADGKTDTNWKGLGTDHLHPDASGYQIWSDAMNPLLNKLLAGAK
jgi:beta-glucosidase